MSSTTILAGSGKATPVLARHARSLRIWLAALAALIVAMILVGGSTRLTDSGLSITEWKPIVGVIPPLSESDWNEAFAAYKTIPEYTELKRGMNLEDFKTIYWWEWAHRFLGRLIGFAFFIPFAAFLIAGYIPRALLPKLLGLFVLGSLQGALGWYMVRSGLTSRTDVSQYRLAAHFGVALLILAYTLWLLLGLGRAGQARVAGRDRSAGPVAGFVLALIFIQMLAGAFVAGTDAGMGYNTWPLINGALVPPGLAEASPWYLNLFENPLTVQFQHRMLGYAVVLAALGQLAWLALKRAAQPLVGSAFTLALFALLQAVLGIWTLLLSVPIALGLAHQAGAIAVFAMALYHFWLARHVHSATTEAQPVASA
ncbi:MAG TPA: COX15/CtaA family protein [Methyloceanibacter sp.]|jgi:cytochrome c oxidase assembly protein subunit 15|nr:COX15/CtaA family protein [Methyloceanibacter sp.]